MFMDLYKAIFRSKPLRKSYKIYQVLSKVLKNRSPRQCRSRYQKVMKIHKNFTHARKHFESVVGTEEYELKFFKFSQSAEQNMDLEKLNNAYNLGVNRTFRSPKPEKRDQNISNAATEEKDIGCQ